MKILVLHHVEKMWQNSIPFDFVEKVIEHIEGENYDYIIASTFEDYQSTGYDELDYYINKIENWSYAWIVKGYGETKKKHIVKEFGLPKKDIIRVSSQHEFAYCYDWIKKLKGNEIFVAGGCRYECLLDLEETLEHLDIPYTTIQELVFG